MKLLPGAMLDACFAGDRSRARQLVDFRFPDTFRVMIRGPGSAVSRC